MRVDMIRSFLKLAESRSYAAAAEALFMNTTTLHGHVKAIEEELGSPLVQFENRHLVLTRAGTQFLLFAERTLAEYDELRDKLHGLPHIAQTPLKVVSLPSPGIHLVPPVVRRYQDTHPDVHVSVDTRYTDEALAALVSRQADVAILHEAHAEHARDVFEMSLVYEDRLTVIVRSDCYEPPDIALLSRYPLAVQPAGNFSRMYIERWARKHGVNLRPRFEHISFDGILSFVLAGECVGVVGGYVAATMPRPDLVTTLDLPAFEQLRRIVALYHAGAGERVRDFVTFFRGFYAEGVLARERSL